MKKNTKLNESLINKAKFSLFTILITAAIVSVPQKAYSWDCNSKCEWYQPDCYAYREYCYYVANICSNTLKVADSQVQSSNGPNLTTLTQYQKSVLRPFLGNLVDQVFLRYNAILAAEYSIDGKPFHRGYGGQTFGNRIYIINPLDEQSVDQLGIIAHEMKHVEQFGRVGDWTRDYCKKWIDADFSYENNQWEIEARAFEQQFAQSQLLPDGSLFRNSQGTIWLIEGGRKRGIIHGTVFTAWGFNPKAVLNVPDNIINSIPDGDLMPYPDGSLIRNSQGTVWRMEGGRKRGFVHGTVFAAYGLNNNNVLNVPDNIINAIPDGDLMPYPDGALIRNSQGTIWRIEGGRKRGIISGEVFDGCGFNRNAVLDVPDNIINATPDGSLIGAQCGR